MRTVSLSDDSILYPSGGKLPLRVALLVKEELRGAQWHARTRLGTKLVVPIGSQVARDAEVLARHLYAAVSLRDGSGAGDDAEAVLIPRIIAIQGSHPITTFHAGTLTLALEWTLEDSKGEPIWAETIVGEGHSRSGGAGGYLLFGLPGVVGGGTSSGRLRTEAKEVLHEVFQQSHERMSASREINAFAAKCRDGEGTDVPR